MTVHKQNLPLAGRHVLVTRAREQAQAFAEKISSQGGIAICYPLLTIRASSDESTIQQLDASLLRLDSFDWIIFTSVNGVKFFFERLHRISAGGIADVTHMKATFTAVGSETARALEQRGITAIYPLIDYQQEGVVELLRPVMQRGQKVLLPTAAVTRDVLHSSLIEMGVDVSQVTVYENVYNDDLDEPSSSEEDWGRVNIVSRAAVVDMLKSGMIDLLPLTSSSNVNYFIEFLESNGIEPLLLNKMHIVCIGEITARTAEDAGLRVTRIAQKATVDSLVEAMIEIINQ